MDNLDIDIDMYLYMGGDIYYVDMYMDIGSFK